MGVRVFLIGTSQIFFPFLFQLVPCQKSFKFSKKRQDIILKTNRDEKVREARVIVRAGSGRRKSSEGLGNKVTAQGYSGNSNIRHTVIK